MAVQNVICLLTESLRHQSMDFLLISPIPKQNEWMGKTSPSPGKWHIPQVRLMGVGLLDFNLPHFLSSLRLSLIAVSELHHNVAGEYVVDGAWQPRILHTTSNWGVISKVLLDSIQPFKTREGKKINNMNVLSMADLIHIHTHCDLWHIHYCRRTLSSPASSQFQCCSFLCSHPTIPKILIYVYELQFIMQLP